VAHLLAKTYPALRWIWIVGDSQDDTYRRLLDIVNDVRNLRSIDLLVRDTGIAGDDLASRHRRLGQTANAWCDLVRPEDDYLLVHESDIISPADVVEAFLGHAQAGRCPVAGWPLLPIGEGQAVFYDIWAYRKDGQIFANCPPFHPCYRPDQPFEVDSFGTCWMMHAQDIRDGARFGDRAVLDMCAWLKAHGRHLWVDPGLVVIQPGELWEPHEVVP